MGRWIWLKFHWQEDKYLYFIHTYMPDNNYGLNTTATQQLQSIMREGKPVELNVRKRYEEDLQNLLNRFTDGYVLLSGDFNMSNKAKFFHNLQLRYGLADVVSEVAEEKYRFIPTFRYGKDRIDHVLASWELVPYINDVRIEDCELLRSDHLPVTFQLQWPSKNRDRKNVRHIKQWQQKRP